MKRTLQIAVAFFALTLSLVIDLVTPLPITQSSKKDLDVISIAGSGTGTCVGKSKT